MGIVYFLYAVVLILAFWGVGVLLKVSLATIVGFIWSICLILILVNLGVIVKTLKPIYEELASKPINLSNLFAGFKAIFQVINIQLKRPPKSLPNNPELENLPDPAEVDAPIEQVIAEIDKQEQKPTSVKTRTKKRKYPKNSISPKEIKTRQPDIASSSQQYVSSSKQEEIGKAIATHQNSQPSLNSKRRYV